MGSGLRDKKYEVVEAVNFPYAIAIYTQFSELSHSNKEADTHLSTEWYVANRAAKWNSWSSTSPLPALTNTSYTSRIW